MKLSSKTWKAWVRGGILALVAADAVLLVLHWPAASAAGDTRGEQLERLKGQHRQIESDVLRAAEIRDRLPEVQRQCDRFLEKQFLDPSEGYRAVPADLSKLSAASGLKVSAINYKQRELAGRGVAAVEVSAAVEGDYSSLVRFVNGLERSERFYLIETLALTSSAGGNIKLNLELRTYFRLKP